MIAARCDAGQSLVTATAPVAATPAATSARGQYRPIADVEPDSIDWSLRLRLFRRSVAFPNRSLRPLLDAEHHPALPEEMSGREAEIIKGGGSTRLSVPATARPSTTCTPMSRAHPLSQTLYHSALCSSPFTIAALDP